MDKYGFLTYFNGVPIDEINNLDYSYLIDVINVKADGFRHYELIEGYVIKVACYSTTRTITEDTDQKVTINDGRISWSGINNIIINVFMEYQK